MSDLARYMRERIAGSSWRPFSASDWWNEYDVVVSSDGGPRPSYDTYVKGMQVASRPSLAEAQKAAESRVGRSLDWKQVELEPVSAAPGSYTEFIWGESEEFSAPTTIWTARLP